MITIRPSKERGHANHGWLDTYHSFSFADYFDPEHMGFRDLRVINEDYIAPARGFGTHPHNDMEIVTYVVSGELSHRDSMGSIKTLKPGDVQAMSAGSGIMHSEFNGSPKEAVHLLQIWIEPKRRGVQPSYGEKHYSPEEKLNKLLPIAGQSSPLKLNQDATIYASMLKAGNRVNHALRGGHAWVQVVSGEVEANGEVLKAGDGAAITNEKALELSAKEDSEMLVFELN